MQESLKAHPFAAAEPGIRAAAAQKLINPKAEPSDKELSVRYNLPNSAGSATGPLSKMQRQFGTNLPPELQAPTVSLQSDTNAASLLNPPDLSQPFNFSMPPADSTFGSTFQEGQKVRQKSTGKIFIIKDGEPVPFDEQ